MDQEGGERVVTVTRQVRVVDRTCPVCGRAFTGLPFQQFCSKLCSNRASYARHAEKRRAERRERYQRQKTEDPPPAA